MRRRDLAGPMARKTCYGTGELPKPPIVGTPERPRATCHHCGKLVRVRNHVLVWHIPPREQP